MKQTLQRTLKKALVGLGRMMPTAWVHGVYVSSNYILLGKWIEQEGFWIQQRVSDKEEVFDAVVREVGQRRVLYLEFGVASGGSLRFWSRKLAHPESKLYGFDSFVGLPEDFDLLGKARRGAFDQKDNLPRVDDERVHLVKGWFDETLPSFTLDPHDILVINCDADLYSSTKTVLKYLTPHITAGTYIYFDDMGRPDHEPKAFREFMLDTGLRFEAIAADVTCNSMFFRCIGKPAVAG